MTGRRIIHAIGSLLVPIAIIAELFGLSLLISLISEKIQ